MVDITFWMGLSPFVYLAYIHIFSKGVPHFKTAPVVADEILNQLCQDMAYKKTPKEAYKIVELGAGFGGVLYKIAKRFPDSKVEAVEIDPFVFFYTWLLSKLKGFKNIKVYFGDFMKRDLCKADAVICYLGNDTMQALGPKLDQELKTGAIILSNSFHLDKRWEVEKFIPVKTRYPQQLGVRLYRK